MLKQKILIVDDDENIAELISLYLEKEQYDTETAHDGEEALQIIEVYNPDLILLDLMLPGIDGYEVCQQVRKNTSRWAQTIIWLNHLMQMNLLLVLAQFLDVQELRSLRILWL